MTRRLTTFDAVWRELGGSGGLALITNRKPQNVCNWRIRGYYPPKVYFLIAHALEARGCEAARELFNFDEVSTADAA